MFGIRLILLYRLDKLHPSTLYEDMVYDIEISAKKLRTNSLKATPP
jgi:hypothetical protein